MTCRTTALFSELLGMQIAVKLINELADMDGNSSFVKVKL
jgi:hypothetical protein